MEDDQRLLQRILDGAEDPTDLALQLLKDITDNFSEKRKIGQGGFGAVYKGILGERIVAVKRIHINEHTIDDKLFHREVTSLMNINHRNIVRFLGVCSQGYQKPIQAEGSGKYIWANVLERLLCFEYISNGSLDKHITDELRGFEWETRYEIITGICKGLGYLHMEKNIIHMDLKPENILLDHQDGKYMVPKITDFGLSRPDKYSHTVGLCFGTLEYLAPEYKKESKTTHACDIYSLGLIIIELVTGCKDIPDKNKVLRRWRHRWNKSPTQLQYQQVTRCIYIAERCREQNPEARPSISKIIKYLGESKSTYGKISPCLYEDDMLCIKPLELQIPSELKEDISLSVELKNNTGNHMAFNIKLPSIERYCAQPDKGIVQPGFKYDVKITVHPKDMHHGDKLTVQSMKDSEGFRNEDVTEHMFEEVGKVVDEVDLMVVYEPKKPQENCKRRGDTNMRAEEVPEAKQRKIVESTSRKGKLDSSENVEAPSMDINSGTQGHSAQQTEQCKLLRLQSFSHHYSTNTKYLGKESPAVDRARGAMGSLLDKLGKLSTQDYSLQTSMKTDIDSFSKDLKNIHRELPKLENVDGAEDFVDEVRELSYNIEDMVDSFLVRVEPNSNGIGFRELTHEGLKLWENGMMTHHKIGDAIRDIKDQVQAVVDRKKKDSFNVNSFVANATDKASIEDLRISAINIGIEHLIGIEAPRDEIIDLFEDDSNISNQNLKIVSIVGLGGLGKTTLAKAVYDKLTKENNYTRAFVPVGQSPVVKEVLKNIISAFENDFNAENWQEWKLREKLQNLLENKRYFIFIDDIWDPSDWGSIRYAFPENKRGSRVITTTRNHEVALACCNAESKYVYWINRLSEEDSKNLFFRRTCRAEKDCPGILKNISVDILKTCGGMPLAINSIASLLAGKKDKTWEYVWKSLGSLTKGKPDLGNMMQILELSYIHLPDHLKTCLLYVCKYREDQEIDKNDLLMQWVAEGFVHVSTNSMLDAEDEAEDYFQKLISLCMIQPGKIDDYSNELLSCRVHDIVLDLLRSKSTEANFIHVIDGFKDVTDARGKIRRVSVQQNDKDDMRIVDTMNKGSLSHVRSILLNASELVPGSFVLHFLKFKYVRVLDLQYDFSGYSKNPVDLTCISMLLLLRYLKIGFIGKRMKLPDQIAELQQLETIYLVGDAENYPSDIFSLPRLSQLNYGSVGPLPGLPDGIGRMKSLRTLENVFVQSVDNIKALGKLTNLRKLKISSYLDGESEEESTKRWNAWHSSISSLSTSLRILTLEIFPTVIGWSSTPFHLDSPIGKLDLSGCHFERCPEWIDQLQHLYSFSISVREVADGIWIVGRLPSLAYFRLCIDETEESVVISGSGAFQALKHLHFECENVDYKKFSLTIEQGALPKLEELDIPLRYNIRRRCTPVGIEHLPAPTLKKITLAVSGMMDDWKVKGSAHWNDRAWEKYRDSDHHADKIEERAWKTATLLNRAFKLHHPSAVIDIWFMDCDIHIPHIEDVDEENYEEDSDKEYDDDSYDDEDYYSEEDNEDCYSSEEDDQSVDDEEADEGAYQMHGPETPVQAQANTRQLVELMEVQEDSGRMSINTNAPLMVDTSVDLAVGSEWQQGRRGSQDLAVLEYSQLPFTGLLAPLPPSLPPITWPDRAKPVANFPVDINNNLLVEHGNTGMLVNAIGQYLHLNQAPTGRLVDLSRAYLAVLESCQLPSTSLLAPLPPSLPPFTWPVTAEPVANFPVDINDDVLVEQGNNGMLVNAVAQYLDLNQAPTGVLVDLNHAYLAVLESLQLPFTSDLLAPNQACNQLTDEEFLELNEYLYVNQAPPGGLAELNQAPNEPSAEEFVELSEDVEYTRINYC